MEKTLLLLVGNGGATPASAPSSFGAGGGMPYDPDHPPRTYHWTAYGAEGLRGHARVRRFRGGIDLDEEELVLLLAFALLV